MSRADRVAELIKQEVSDIFTRKLSDPRIGFVSVTGVDIGADLHNATIYVSILGSDEEKVKTMTALHHASRFVRGELGHRIQLRDVPEICFKQDESIERGARIFELLNKIHQDKETSPAPQKRFHILKKAAGKRGIRNAKSNRRGKKG